MKHRAICAYVVAAIISVVCQPLTAQIITITNEQDFNAHVQSGGNSVVQFAADWCGVCAGVKKPFEEISNEEMFKEVKFVRVNIDNHQALTDKQGIVGVPTFMYYHNGVKKDSSLGVQDMSNFKHEMRQKIKNSFNLAQHTIANVGATLSSDSVVTSENSTPDQTQTITTSTPQPQPIAAPVPVEPAPEPQGMVAQIVGFVQAVVDGIKSFFYSIIDTIKGIFTTR